MNLTERIAYLVSGRSRRKKHEHFLLSVMPKRQETVLDIGVNDTEYSDTDNYLEKNYAFPENITVVSHQGLDTFSKRYPKIRAIVADGLDLPFQDNSFDISYSNAVIEHVGKHDQQLRFLKESFRVAQRGYFTTPNRHFPIEVHTRIPLLHLILPKRYFDMFLGIIGKSWATGDYMNLLSYKELDELLNETDIKTFHIHKNRFMGIPITFSVIWKK